MSLSGITLERYANISLKPVSWLRRSLWGRGGLGGGGLGGRGFNDDEKKKFLITVFPRISAHTLGHNVKQAPPSNNRPPLFPNFLN